MMMVLDVVRCMGADNILEVQGVVQMSLLLPQQPTLCNFLLHAFGMNMTLIRMFLARNLSGQVILSSPTGARPGRVDWLLHHPYSIWIH
jgi:hypothetical protein